MPLAKKRARSYDPAKIRTAVRAQFGHVRTAVESLTPEQLAAPTRLGEWTVRELAAHITMAVNAVGRALDAPAPAKADLTLAVWPTTSAPYAQDIDAYVTELAASAEPAALYGEAAVRLEQALADEPGDRIVATRTGALTLADYLVTRTVELVVHTDDLNDALPALAIPYDRQALAACTRLLADALALKAPGASTEVRVPPFAVVQCVEGPRHTRGTPPNVVETEPLTWIRLATGRLAWQTALDDAQVSASGERADLESLLPIMA
ncbi:maleylpyruvate isomerase family mycothiol-dependent enzyme [Streptomyces sp. VRA16 Mangrove soil]|uniref:maleylpyruvate isomerase family mycothiol-dependent enzyme n=1 Tax=Streptomyces sp. VRA16 Mangrove soil TaxID=2817434 RepID=UPI001A9F4FCD|nr:maleylpyruvate isomerase family mycothiol-dependent enzyme [Streptomyces sp. VRA16 Mangrove soil]MBO1337357.1 maleylpyruvate isomerase family mycothiol-dependent enzyme [Streptomyces sp. VRA16 Mangrove soil]